MSSPVIARTGLGPVLTPTAWSGQNLCVHRSFVKGKDGRPVLTDKPKCWTVTHNALGLAAYKALDCTKSQAIKLAKLWDDRFADIVNSSDVGAWRYRLTWAEDCRRVNGGGEPEGPVLPDHPTSSDVARAVGAAIGATAGDDDSEDPSQPFPSTYVLADKIRQGEDEWPEFFWRGRWWPVPSLGEMESYLFDSVAETPDGRTVEPDHPESWPALFGLI